MTNIVENPMRSIALVLGDNDFEQFLEELLASTHRAIKYQEHTQYMTRDDVINLINSGLEFHLRAFNSVKSLDYVKSKLRILFDDEAEQAYQTIDYDRGAFFLHIESGQISFF